MGNCLISCLHLFVSVLHFSYVVGALLLHLIVGTQLARFSLEHWMIFFWTTLYFCMHILYCTWNMLIYFLRYIVKVNSCLKADYEASDVQLQSSVNQRCSLVCSMNNIFPAQKFMSWCVQWITFFQRKNLWVGVFNE